MPPTRARLTLAKEAEMRFTGHLDLHLALERTFRRAHLPLAYSKGFKPRARITLASPLPLGFTSQGELADVWLEGEPALGEVLTDLQEAAPPGIRFTEIATVADRTPKLPNLLRAADYRATLLEPHRDLERRLETLLIADALPRERRGKMYDLRPLIEALERSPDDEKGRPRLSMRLTALPGATGRPDEVLDALGIAPETTLIHRVRLVLAKGDQGDPNEEPS
jgi:radical SAM-linked protein